MNRFYNPFYHNKYIGYPQITPTMCKTSPANLPPLKNVSEANSAITSNTNNQISKSTEINGFTYENFSESSSASNNYDSKKHLSEKPLLEFHGIQLYSDDLLILLLIFFLYKENINDILLFVALFSLLF